MKLLFKYCERFEPRSHFLNIVTVITCGMGCRACVNWKMPQKSSYKSVPRLLSRIVDALTSEPTVRSCDTSQQIPYFDSCQLSLVWKSKIKFNAGCHTC